jgi:opacity protein-like surface antigen
MAAAALVALLVFALAANARAEEKNFGVGLMVGYHNFVRYEAVAGPNSNGILDDGEIDRAVGSGAFNGFTIEGDFEYRFFPYFELGGALQWYGADASVDTITEKNRVRGNFTVSVTALTITPRLVLPLDPVRLYTGAGIGLYWRVMDTSFSVLGENDVTTSENNTDSSGQIGYHVMVGAEFIVTPWLGVTLEDRFAFVHFRGQDPVTNLDDGDFGGNSVLIGTRFHF